MVNALTSNGAFGNYLHDPMIAACFSAPAFTNAMLQFERAWTGALYDVGKVGEAEREAVHRLIDAIDVQTLSLGEASTLDGVPVPALVAQLRDQLGAAAPALHTGATSQDVIDTAMVLVLRSATGELVRRLEQFDQMMGSLKTRFGAKPLTARTRMQSALPASVDLRLSVWQRSVRSAAETLKTSCAALPVQIGGPVGARDALDQGETIAAIVARELDLPLSPVWHADRQALVSYGNCLCLVAGSLGKFGQDIALMAQQGVDDIAFRGGGRSSAMPHKQNPVRAEALVALARYVAGQQGILAQALVHEQERSGSAWALEWLTLPSMCEAVGASAAHAIDLTDRVERIGR